MRRNCRVEFCEKFGSSGRVSTQVGFARAFYICLNLEMKFKMSPLCDWKYFDKLDGVSVTLVAQVSVTQNRVE